MDIRTGRIEQFHSPEELGYRGIPLTYDNILRAFRDGRGTAWLVNTQKDTIVFLKYNETTDRIEKVARYFKPGSWSEGGDIQISHDRSRIAMLNAAPGSKYVRGFSNQLSIADFNWETGEVADERPMYFRPIPDRNDSSLIVSTINFKVLCFSPNDSFLYTAAIGIPASPWEEKGSLFQFLTHASMDGVFDYYVLKPRLGIHDLKIAPNGKMLIGAGRGWTTGGIRGIPFLRYPNRVGEASELVIDHPTELNFNLHISPTGYRYCREPVGRNKSGCEFEVFSQTLGPYKRAEFSASQTCNGLEVAFRNLSDTFWWERYKLHLPGGVVLDIDEQQEAFYREGRTVRHTFPAPGKYDVQLQAFNKQGGWVWYADTVVVHPPPEADFEMADSIGCEHIAVTLRDRSTIRYSPKGELSYTWLFGDGEQQSSRVNPAAMPLQDAGGYTQHIYRESGLYEVGLIVSDGYCRDTVYKPRSIRIRPAAQPGIELSDTLACTPLDLRYRYKYRDVPDSLVWDFGDGRKHTVLGSDPTLHAWSGIRYEEPGDYTIGQTLYDSSGCITRASMPLRVLQGLEEDYMPRLLNAQMLGNDSAEVIWQGHAQAAQYRVFQNGNEMAQTSDTAINLHHPTVGSVYTLRAENKCGALSRESNIGKPVTLSANSFGEYSVVEWTTYEYWPQGVASYALESGSTSGDLEEIGTWDQLDYTDHAYIEPNGVQKCYRVRALDHTGTWSSRSNVVCLPYHPTLFIPNAFSPNGDGLNDVWQLSSLGFVEMTLQIYDRWGGLVYQGDRGSWDGQINGKAAPAGVYTYMLSAVAHTGRKVHREGVVRVLR
ncbi:MAG: gliding motility-associated C-terminal domain-containing protein [Flavobacteriales bacterium]|nr:gliding motility-associated C-terminal domain-containing protein [Flavobacteriales bacterium]